jgi:DNA replication protein DnaC
MERDKAVAQLGRQLERQAPVTEPFDFWALVPGKDELPPENPAIERARIELERGRRLLDSGIDKAITDEDFDRLTKAWRKHVEVVNGKERVTFEPVIAKPGKPLEPWQVAFECDTDALRNVHRWQNARSTRSSSFGVLALLGETGVGKTVSFGWLLAGLGGMYTTAEKLRASFASTHYRERELYLRALKTMVLIVDELGCESDAEGANAMLFDLMNSRRGTGRSGLFWTGFASNLSDDDFRGRIDPRTVYRIEQLGVVFTCKGDNLRGRLIDQLKKDKAKREGREE